MVMAYILLAVLFSAEVGFIIFDQIRKSSKAGWSKRRLIVNAGQAVLFALMLAFPGIDTSFRFRGLMILLAVRIIFAALFAFINRKKDIAKKTSGRIVSLILSIILISGAMMPAFIFADYDGLPLNGPYKVDTCNAILVDENRTETFENDGSFREVPVYFLYPSDAEEGERFPLVVFSHGAFGYYQSNVSTYMELASHGYVVVSIEHPYHSFFTKDTDGKIIIVDSGFMNSVMTTGQEGTEEEIFEVAQEWMKIRTGDMNFALDELIKGADENDTGDYWFADAIAKADTLKVLGMTDTERIGLMGHSMGGATSVEVGKERDDIDAVIDIDGTMLGSITGAEDGKFIVEDMEYKVPVFEIENMNAHKEAIEAEQTGYPYPNNMIRKNADVYYGTYFEGALHMDYTDLPMFSPFLGKMLGSGDVDNAYVMNTVNSLAVSFFDCYLKGEGRFSVEASYQGVG